VGIDGSKALRKAVIHMHEHPVIQRCRIHTTRNVKDHLPQRLRSTAGRRMTAAYHFCIRWPGLRHAVPYCVLQSSVADPGDPRRR
jgi:hypothetical protein